jgi:hypothetical protein
MTDQVVTYQGVDADERAWLERLFVIADEAIAAGMDVLPAAVWVKPDGTVGKAPLLPHGHLGAHRDRQRICQELADVPHVPTGVPENFEVVVGVRPGSGGFVLLDADIKAGKAGEASMEALRAEHGDFATAAWRTPSGGVNVLLRKPPGAAYSNHSAWDGIDVRADGGWVVAPGNICVGGRWAWLDGRAGYERASPLPDGISAQLKAASQSERKASNAETVELIEASPVLSTVPVMQRFSAQLEDFRRAGTGSRHDALLRIVGWSFGMEHLDLRWALERIKAEWQHLTAGEGREDEVTEIACWVAGQEIAKRAAQVEQPPPGPVTGDEPVDEDDGVMAVVDWSKLHDPVDDLVDGIAGPGRWTQIVAPAKGGKSTLLMYMALELSEGRDPFDGGPIEPVVVLYVDGEMGLPDVEELVRACGYDPKMLARWYAADELPRLDTDRDAERLLACVEAIGAKVVVLDGLNGFINPEASERLDDTWRPLYKRTITPLKQRGVTILSGDNLGKDRSQGPRGSSVKMDKSDVVFELKPLDHGVRLHPTHRRSRFTSADVDLSVVGIDRSVPIRFRRAAGWPDGTKDTVDLLTRLGVPLTEGRDKIRARLRDEVAAAERAGRDADEFRVRNDVLAAAIRFRRLDPAGAL